jgi:hypothetical protein
MEEISATKKDDAEPSKQNVKKQQLAETTKKSHPIPQ